MEFIWLALGSFGLGAAHALEPGHGKTVVGAYLIGSKGRISDAILLGIVVTLTHSGSVILLGVLSTVAAAYFVPETVGQVLEVVSGLLVLLVGGWMLTVRLRQAKAGDDHHHEHEQLSHEELHAQGLTHDHDHHHSHETEASHSHWGGESHSHPRAPELRPGERPSLGQLIALGISGGLVPCPAALTVLLAAVSYGEFAKGLSLVLIFSLGMAAVLVAIGIAMVKAAAFASKRLEANSRAVAWAPVVSAILITAVGAVLTVRALWHLGLFQAG
jgi:nickel/cobalt exporter